MTDDRPANRLAAERSPYLQQHGHNPVDWYPWGPEALARAESLDRPIFLSIGYSACHWCHVMERESFEDRDVAEVLNAHFVCVKVDREERPDIDQTYQLAHQVLARRGGGWPLSVFLTPALQPFYTGTYFPTPKRDGMPSFTEVLHAILDAWRNRRRDVDAQAEEVTLALMQESSLRESPDDPDRAWLPTAVRALLGRVDPEHGGFGRAPKFPNTMSLDLLATAAVVDPDGVGPAARAAVDRTLDAMARGGIWDHLGGGFARYSVDAEWRVPHFEKMLYDNAQLLRVYAAASRGADGPREDRVAVARDIAAYLAREMTSPEGAFYSAQDADSEGEEGRFFTWTPESVRAVVGDDAPAVCAWYDVTPEGNFEHGRSVLWTPRSPSAVAEALGLTEPALADVVARARPKLFAAREARPKPLRDEKCLAAWNGLAIGALADAGATLATWELVERAEHALRVWHDRAWRDDRLAHAMKDGAAYGVGFLDDHAALACAAVDVWEAGGGAWCLAWARALVAQVLARFVDDDEGGVFYTPSDAEVVLVRSKDPTDHAYPGGVGLCLEALQRLSVITGERRLRDVARRLTAQYGPTSREHPIGMATVLHAADRGARGMTEIILVGERGTDAMRAMVHAAHAVPVAHRVVVSCAGVHDAVEQGVDRELLEGRACRDDGAPTAYVCQGMTCEMPVHTPDALRGVLLRIG